MLHGNVFSRVCSCTSVCNALTFESLELETGMQVQVHWYSIRIFRSDSYVKVIGSWSRSQEQKNLFFIHISWCQAGWVVCYHWYLRGWSAFSWKAVLSCLCFWILIVFIIDRWQLPSSEQLLLYSTVKIFVIERVVGVGWEWGRLLYYFQERAGASEVL